VPPANLRLGKDTARLLRLLLIMCVYAASPAAAFEDANAASLKGATASVCGVCLRTKAMPGRSTISASCTIMAVAWRRTSRRNSRYGLTVVEGDELSADAFTSNDPPPQ
jgi:hypothetical protein